MNSGADHPGGELPRTLHRLLGHFSRASRVFDTLRHGPRKWALSRSVKSAAATAPPAPLAPQAALLLAMVAHELRTPLGTIQMAAAGFERGCGTADEAAHFKAVLDRQVRRMSRLVQDLLDAEAARTGHLGVESGRARVRDVIDEALETCRPSLDRRQQRMVLHALPPDDCFIDGDGLRLTQIVVNLLDNASKYTPGGGEVGLKAVVTGRALQITVRDNGIGIAPELLRHVFEPFVREARAARFNDAGLGLGLTLVRHLTAAHGGEVQALSSGVGRGSRFVVTLPMLRPERPRRPMGQVVATGPVR